MQKKGLIEKIDESYVNRIGLCYKCKNVLEPLPLEQWFVKVKPLAENAIKVVKNKKIKITPKNFETIYFQWLENLRDWNISRQTVWGIRIPAFKCEKCTKWIVTDGKVPEKCANCNSNKLIQDTDTFDTWFSSGQWPFAALRASRVSTDLKTFYPTSVMETGRDILFFWVARMVMLGFYITDEAPFKEVLFHGLVNDPYGRKMSKSKGNVVNPLELVDQYGADAVRFALIYGNATGNDQALSYTKLDGARKFANKLWNMARFIEMKRVQSSKLKVKSYEFEELLKEAKNETDKEWVKKTQGLVSEVSKYIDNYQFNLAAERLYEFIWHEFADKYIEDVKNRIDENSYLILAALYLILLKLLHPFMPFITEEINKQLGFSQDLIISAWPHD